jgi:prepilin-type N-terminal cleavage/methylation domain-containing protein
VNKFKLNQGFTLMEMVVVMIILGILGTVVYTGILRQINTQQGQEALSNMSFIRTAMENCGVAVNFDFTTCTWANIAMADPSGAKFTYTLAAIDGGSGAGSGYTITASSASPNGTIVMRRTNAGMSCTSATGAYAGLC